MPRYEYKCLSKVCEQMFEVTHKITEDPVITCIRCDSDTQRQISKNVMFETTVDVDWEWETLVILVKNLLNNITKLRK